MLTGNRLSGSPFLHTEFCFCEMPISWHPCATTVTVCNFCFWGDGRREPAFSVSKTERFFGKPKKADNDNDIDIDNDIDNDIDSDSGNG